MSECGMLLHTAAD